jgi:translation initiation factor IF-2
VSWKRESDNYKSRGIPALTNRLAGLLFRKFWNKSFLCNGDEIKYYLLPDCLFAPESNLTVEIISMSHKPKHKPHRKHAIHADSAPRSGQIDEKSPTLLLVVKGDTGGSVEAVSTSLMTNTVPGVALEILYKGVGDICKNDVLTAAGGSRLIVGFNVGVLTGVNEFCQELDVEIRLYSVIYHLQKDILAIAESLLPREAEEQILGSATVIALFKSSRKGIILGCRVDQGRLQAGDRFRIIAAMGPIYSGIIESLHIERDAVTKATTAQQVGLKINDFKAIQVGDKVETYRVIPPAPNNKWTPSGEILQN